MNIGDQPAIEARFQAFLDAFQVRRRFIRRQNDLAALIDEGIKGMEKFLLGRIAAADELNVIDHQNINRAELILEIHGILLAQGAHKSVHEFFRR